MSVYWLHKRICGSWSDGSVVKRAFCSSKGPKLGSQHSQEVIHLYPEGIQQLQSPQVTAHMCTYSPAHTHTIRSKINITRVCILKLTCLLLCKINDLHTNQSLMMIKMNLGFNWPRLTAVHVKENFYSELHVPVFIWKWILCFNINKPKCFYFWSYRTSYNGNSYKQMTTNHTQVQKCQKYRSNYFQSWHWTWMARFQHDTQPELSPSVSKRHCGI